MGGSVAIQERLEVQQGVLNVKSSFLLATLVATVALVGFEAQTASAQNRGTNVAVIDISYVFKNHERFKKSQEEMKRDVDEFDAFVRSKQKEMRDLAEKLKSWKTGSPQYKQTEEKMARISSDVQVQTQLKRKNFLEREAKLYAQTYREILDQVRIFAEQNRIDLVLRFNSEEIKDDDRQSVLAGVNRSVIYENPQINITGMVLKNINRGQAAPRAATRPSIPRNPRRQ